MFLALGGLAVAGYVVLPTAARDAVYLAVGLAACVAIVVGVHVLRPVRRAPWWLMAAGQLSWIAGDVVYTWYESVLAVEPFPSPADVLYLAAYPLLAVAFALLIRGRRSGRDRDGLIDSAIFTVAVGLLSWVFLMRPTLLGEGVDVVERAIALAYPLGDILLLGVLLRLLAGPGARSPAFGMLAAACGLLVLADAAFAVLATTSSYGGGWVDLLWLGSYVLWGAAALHPSMRGLSLPSPDGTAPFTRRRLAALTVAILAAPATLAAQLLLGMALDGWAVVVGSTVLSVLVVVRMSGLLTRLQAQAGRLDELARTDALTGLPNRRSADAELARMRRVSALDGRPLVVAMLDLDRFKAFNDTYGHGAGDRLLTEAADAWRGALGSGPLLARYGGEEFVVAFTGLSLPDAVDALDRVRAVTPGGQTVSVGAALWDGVEDTAALTQRADVALYAAKRAGRDRVVAAEGAARTGAVLPTQADAATRPGTVPTG
ncbi:GGDEF domain-containing protein [Cellulomonas sp. ATA003]|uniref:GGDEF domain-containing protein n=1 Tax=Cellulomonas sp. ATA003 TaxID=3073064 RepID=UPI002872BF19|nr:GGDEF domain-containing protein [Cellulomonas sp. ATA003]WNB85867.1 GGDEF domain-containing protein [Cellulomonas sp. ATA003]